MRQSVIARRLIAVLLSAALGGTIALSAPVASASAASDTDLATLQAKVVYLQGKGDLSGRDAAIAAISKQSAWQGKLWKGFVGDWTRVLAGMKMNTSVPSGLPSKNHAFVVLGSALTSSGKVSAKLERRLKLALKAAQTYPHSTLLVSGGAPRNGKTEAAVMKAWLLDHGVDKDRIITETKSSSTVGNARYSMEILADRGGFTSYTVVTDSSHIRRSSVLFLAAKLRVEENRGKAWSMKPVANLVFPDLATAGQKPLSASSAAYAASNVAGVFGLTAKYKALAAGPSPSVTLSSIRVTEPTDLSYGLGEKLNLAGFVVTAGYSDGSTRVVTDDVTLSGFSSAKIATGTVTVTYSEGSRTKEVSFDYQVGKAASSAKITLGAAKAKLLKTKLSVQVKIAAGPVKPTGKISLYLDGKLARTVTLKKEAAGVAKFTFVFSKTGSRQFTVKYSGDAQTTAVSGKAVKVTVTK
ncbi:Ig-like domain-containing protein [Propionicimonas paludicola]|uniref:Ig-like domain-containing protein n=1 Tax=Propionicimonas paludicola TaxID=185243 RepID=A0A2A9CU81_9ACTN|nr:ElyC/SanA/YdcF family protein [Propionicimonas paludicola]PFG17109.1 Ig-like domain-containing protein [Propionicimonas paludicola]